MIISKGILKRMAWYVLYFWGLVLVYCLWVSPNYKYAGYVFRFSLECFIFALIASVIVAYFTAGQFSTSKVCDNIIGLISILYFFPQMVLCAFCLNDIRYFCFVMLYWALLVFWNKYLPIKTTKIVVKERKLLFEIIIVGLSLMMVAISGLFSGFRISFDLSEYYEYRFQIREVAMPSILRYVLNWARTLLPLGMIYAMITKRKWMAVVMVVSQILCFSFDGKKSALFMMFLTIVVFYFYKDRFRDKMPLYVFGMSIFTLIESALRSGASFVGKHIIRRMLFVPSYLGWAYFDYFQTHTYDYLRGSILRWFGLKSIYTESIPRIIGSLYTTSSVSGVNANTGLCGDAFSNFGWISLAIYPLLDLVIFRIIGKYSDEFDYRVKIIISLIVAYTFLSGSFFTLLLTNGILLMIILTIVMPKNVNQSEVSIALK